MDEWRRRWSYKEYMADGLHPEEGGVGPRIAVVVALCAAAASVLAAIVLWRRAAAARAERVTSESWGNEQERIQE